MYALIFVIGVWFLPSNVFVLLFMVGLTILMVLFQYGISPLIINWLYRIDWIPYEQFVIQFPHLAESLEKVVAYNRIKMPRLGIIHDLNPNAFTFGWTKNSARVVLTDGILKYLNKKEQNAVFSHELGHVVHSDFILMTVVFAIPLLLLTIARWGYYARFFAKRGDSDEAALIQIALLIIAALSYLAYFISYFISLIISRIREYYADEHSAEVLEDPNALATGLVKIAYGLLVDSNIEERKKSRVLALRGLGIFDPGAAKGLGIISVGTTQTFSMEAIQKAAAWDLYNPWAKYYQALSTHPLPAKRIQRLNMLCEIYGIKPEIDFADAKRLKEQQAGKSLWDEFLWDLVIKALPTLVFIALLGLTIVWIFDLVFVDFNVAFLAPVYANMWLVWAIGFYVIGFMSIIKTKYMYKGGFEDKTVLDLVTNVKVSPIRPIPAFIEGKIVGKGIPGYYFSEDMYFQDETGLMYVDYRFGIGIMDLIFSLGAVNRLIGQRVRIKGWYRRGPSPYIQVDTIWSEDGKRRRNYAKSFRYFWAILSFIIGIACFYFWLPL